MNQINFFKYAFVFSPCIVFSTVANASTQFDTQATIAFSVQSILNESSPNNTVAGDVLIDAGFQYRDEYQPEPHRSWLVQSGNAALSVSDSNLSFQGAYGDDTRLFTHQFYANGNVSNGELYTYQLGWYNWTVTNNNTSDTYSLNLNFNYLLNAVTSGDFANAIVSLNYFSDDDGNFVGFDEIESHVFAPSVQAQGGFNWILTLNPGESRTYLVDVAVNAVSVAEVPVPPALWSFLLGFGLMAFQQFGATRSRLRTEH